MTRSPTPQQRAHAKQARRARKKARATTKLAHLEDQLLKRDQAKGSLVV